MKSAFTIILLVITVNLWSQINHRRIPATYDQQNFDVTVQPGKSLRHGFINDINTRAMRHFIESFENADNTLWNISEKGTTVSFIINKQQITSYYDKLGDHLFTIKTYPATELDPTVARVARKELANDFSIYLVTEKQMTDCVLYEISLQNSLYWCKVKLTRKKDGTLEKLSDNALFRKG